MTRLAVLVVDDEPTLRALFVRALAPRFHVVGAASYAQALEVLKQTSFAVVVSDLDLGGVPDGLTLLTEVGARMPSARRLLITGTEMQETEVEGRVDEVLCKPFLAVELLTVVVELTERA